MSAVLKLASILSLFLVLVCDEAFSDGDQRAFAPLDESVSVSLQKQGRASSSDLKSCLSPAPSYRVRFQVIKGKTATFTRTPLKREDIFAHASDMDSSPKTNIGNCALAADAGGFAGFSYENETCTVFNMDSQICRCGGVGDAIFYVQDSFWDPKDSVLPQTVGGTFLSNAVFRVSSTIYDKIDLFGGRITLSTTFSGAACSNAKGSCLCLRGECYYTPLIDIENCDQKTCDDTGITVFIVLTYFDSIIEDEYPTMALLSECGKTVNASSGVTWRIMSHSGYGCKWYPKDGNDQECVVTITGGSSAGSVAAVTMVLDGDTNTCQGDSLIIYNGTSTNDNIINSWDACRSAENKTTISLPLTFVFKRTATQYQTDGFNWGFIFDLKV